jgi:hypothetical protein
MFKPWGMCDQGSVPVQAELELMEEVKMPELDCCELRTWSVVPPLAATWPVLALLLEPETLELSAPELLWPLLMLPGGVALVLNTPDRPAWDKPLLAELAAPLAAVVPVLLSTGDEVDASRPLLPEVPVVTADKLQLTCLSM